MLTDAQRERLIMLAEEAAEVIQAATKILRHEYENVNPDATSTQIDNKRQLEKELTDFSAVCSMMLAHGDILPVDTDEKILAHIRKRKYSKYQVFSLEEDHISGRGQLRQVLLLMGYIVSDDTLEKIYSFYLHKRTNSKSFTTEDLIDFANKITY